MIGFIAAVIVTIASGLAWSAGGPFSDVGLLFTQGTRIQDSTHAQREQAAEYSVYSYLLRGNPKGTTIVNDSTSPAFQGRPVFCFEPDRKPGSCLEPEPGTSVETWKSFARKNRKPQLIQPLFDKDLGVILKRDSMLPEPTCDGPTITYFSSVGFNADLTEAAVHFSIVRGKGPMPPCGWATFNHLVLRKTPTGWAPFGRQTIGIT
jgi:hypothetical protein